MRLNCKYLFPLLALLFIACNKSLDLCLQNLVDIRNPKKHRSKDENQVNEYAKSLAEKSLHSLDGLADEFIRSGANNTVLSDKVLGSDNTNEADIYFTRIGRCKLQFEGDLIESWTSIDSCEGELDRNMDMLYIAFLRSGHALMGKIKLSKYFNNEGDSIVPKFEKRGFEKAATNKLSNTLALKKIVAENVKLDDLDNSGAVGLYYHDKSGQIVGEFVHVKTDESFNAIFHFGELPFDNNDNAVSRAKQQIVSSSMRNIKLVHLQVIADKNTELSANKVTTLQSSEVLNYEMVFSYLGDIELGSSTNM